ncbi:group III truncated hemoglobin [Deinococcus apachensis]|uniref:group III truncated hemoglobin n=1 Tax=Deinococcus apachensis TaxID=309886 RepID=UPI00037C96E2|nr:group III truncated hemoglobin [Deinococcus apachensis]
MTPSPLLTTSPLTAFGVGVVEATPDELFTAAGLLVPHDGGPVADIRDRPDRWALLTLLSGAVRRSVPVLAWGTGAAMAGRALGARVRVGGGPDPALEWSELPRGAVTEEWEGEVPLLWRAGNVTAWAGVTLPEALREAFLAGLASTGPRTPGTPLEMVGGEAALRPLLADFYARARADDLLGPLFAAHVTDWDAHLDRVTAFWVTMLGGGAAWRGNLNSVHAGLGIRGPHLARWLALFRAAAQAHLSPQAAALLTTRAEAMGARLGQGKRGNGPHVRRVP